ncbi:MAG: hypothetical protein LBH71_04590 [Oscillospiraceae bacterium]|jgi:nitrogen regulatory protein PII|nr:hypothetical protein [Oscillospiraceae bacterium]
MSDESKKPVILKLLVAIVDAGKEQKVTEAIKSAHAHLHFQFRGEGTANSEMLDYLGLGSTDKSVTFCLVPYLMSHKITMKIASELHMAGSGNGIVFTLPLSGASNLIIKLLNEEINEETNLYIESEVEKMGFESTHDLIITVINQGYSEELMEAARPAGAFGGTVIHARRMGLEDTIKFWGISVHPEKEIVAIVTERDKKVEIMKAIANKCGINTEAHGISFSLPVDSVMGIKTSED